MKTRILVAGLFAAASLLAQPPGGPGPRGGRMGFGPGGPGFGGPGPMGLERGTVTGAPFAGDFVVTEQQTLANGNVITRQNITKVYRDSQGRVRTEETMVHRGGAGANTGTTSTGATSTPRTIVRISDPVAGVVRELDAEAKVVHENQMRRPPANRPNPNTAGVAGGPRGRGMLRGNGAASTDPNIKTEDLGTQSINGVMANGTRVTHTIPAGAIGNAQAIQTTFERWVSADLKVPILEKTTDPRFGTTVRQLNNINRSEPDAALFQAPTGYTVQTGGRGRGFGRGGPGGPGGQIR